LTQDAIGKDSSAEYVQLASALVEESRKQNVVLRASAGVGYRMHCNGIEQKYSVLRRPIHDIDLIGRSKNLKNITRIMETYGFVKVPTSLNAAFSLREIYIHPKTRSEVDVFLDRLQMNHTIEFKDRLELDYPTITVSDLLLQKLQIVKLNMKDVTDVVMLLAEHSLGEGENEQVNLTYISKILSEDWGFCFTATTNLQKISDQVGTIDGLDKPIVDMVKEKCQTISKSVEDHPKGLGWRLRAKVGTSKRWYREVEREADVVVTRPTS
jgi:hypothetical protein